MAWSVNEGWDHLQGENTVLHGHGCGWRCATRVRVSDSAKILGTCQYHLESDKGAGYLTRQKKKDKGVQVTMWIYPQDRGRADPAKMVDRSIPLPLSSQHADHTFLSLILNRQLGPIPKSRDSPNLYLVPKLNYTHAYSLPAAPAARSGNTPAPTLAAAGPPLPWSGISPPSHCPMHHHNRASLPPLASL